MLENHRDMIVNLNKSNLNADYTEYLKKKDVIIRKPLGPEKFQVTDWVDHHFGKAWASEADVAICNKPVSCLIAITGKEIAGFACYDSTALGYFGPLGVDERYRSCGIGKALLLSTLSDMRAKGYAYAIIGLTDKFEFYEKLVGATVIAQSDEGIWSSWLGRK